MMTPVSYAAFEAVTDRASAMSGSIEVGMATTLFVIHGLTAVLDKSPTGPLVIRGGRDDRPLSERQCDRGRVVLVLL